MAIPCNSNYSIIKNVLIDSVDVADVHQNFYNVNNLYDLFTNVTGDTILEYLKEIDLHVYTQI
jgi:flagellar biosynthesis regulator FlbT